MKIALLADIHFQKYADEDFRLHDLNDVISQVCEYCVDRKIDRLVLLGDFWSNRKTIDVQVLHSGHQALEKLANTFSDIVVIPGNHDFWFKSNDEVCSIHHFSSHKNCRVIKAPSTEDIDGTSLCYFPYIESQEKLLMCLEKTRKIEAKRKVFFMHQCVLGCSGDSGFKIMSGTPPETILKYCDIAFSGDIHTHQILKSSEKQFVYVGAPLAQTFNDESKTFGFIVLDTDTLGWKRIKTTHRQFHTVLYENLDNERDKIKDNIVKIVFNGNELWTKEGINDIISKSYEKYAPKRIVTLLTDKTNIESTSVESVEEIKSFEFKQLLKEYIKRTKPENLNAKILSETLNKIKETT